MGLASKVAASGIQQPAYYTPPNQQWPPQSSQPGQYGQGQHQYQTYTSSQQQPSYSQQPYGQGGYPASVELPGSSSYTQHQPSRPSPAANPTILFKILKETVEENALHQYYNDQTLQQLAADIARRDPVTTICQLWKIPLEIGFDLVKLSLYDTVFLLDDSASIEFSSLQNELKSILRNTALAASLFDQDGFAVRFMNSNLEGNNIKTESQAEDLLNNIAYSGTTPLVRSLKDKILHKFLGAETGPTPFNLRKPLLVIIITDGVPTDNANRAFQDLIYTYKTKPVSFQIAQVGVDQDAQDFLSSLDSDPKIGSLIDCTSNFEMESAEFQRINPQNKLTRELWYTKLLLGGIDRSYDNKDEKNQVPQPPPKNYGGGGQYQQSGAPYNNQNASGNPQYPNQPNYQPPNHLHQNQQYPQPPHPQDSQSWYGQQNAGQQPAPYPTQQPIYGQQQYMAPPNNPPYPPSNSPGHSQNPGYSKPQQQAGAVYTAPPPPSSYTPNPSYQRR